MSQGRGQQVKLSGSETLGARELLARPGKQALALLWFLETVPPLPKHKRPQASTTQPAFLQGLGRVARETQGTTRLHLLCSALCSGRFLRGAPWGAEHRGPQCIRAHWRGLLDQRFGGGHCSAYSAVIHLLLPTPNLPAPPDPR